MYEDIVKTVPLTSDELDLLKVLVEAEMDNTLSVGEEITVRDLLEKLND